PQQNRETARRPTAKNTDQQNHKSRQKTLNPKGTGQAHAAQARLQSLSLPAVERNKIRVLLGLFCLAIHPRV
ncbi:MAG TPA: hypothetical protein PLO75_05395, partial [Thermotogota bacterium]|nr:hypothetical protein [Thermotogota bacterium]